MPAKMMRSELPTIDEFDSCACHELRKVTRRVTQMYDRTLEPVGLTGTQFSVLANLEERTDLSVGELASRLVMDPSTLTRVLRPLERQGYVEIVGLREDRRRRVAILTKLGRKVFVEAVPLWRHAQTQLVDVLGKQQYRALQTSLANALSRLTHL
jgi:DNA-binding MarR family transcriptional regulator